MLSLVGRLRAAAVLIRAVAALSFRAPKFEVLRESFWR